jgi:hypothetical protein
LNVKKIIKRLIPDQGSITFINDWFSSNEGAVTLRFCPFDLQIRECPGRPECNAKHLVVVIVVLNFGATITLGWSYEESEKQ